MTSGNVLFLRWFGSTQVWKIEVVSGQCIYCITLCIHVVFHYFLNEYSNLKAECKKDVVHDAFDAIYRKCSNYSATLI